MSLTSTTSSSGSSRDSRGVMEDPSGSEASAENGAGSPRGRHPPNGNPNSSGWLSVRGPLSPFSSRAPAAPAHKLSYLGRVVREIVETERMYVQDLRSIVEVRPATQGAKVGRGPGLWLLVAQLCCKPASTPGRKLLPDSWFQKTCFPWSSGEVSCGLLWGSL